MIQKLEQFGISMTYRALCGKLQSFRAQQKFGEVALRILLCVPEEEGYSSKLQGWPIGTTDAHKANANLHV